jgi:heme-degrading monooxygenase HmoA
MFTVIYTFKVKPNNEKDFITSWKRLTEFIYQYEGSLGSRLHKQKSSEYIAYAQWPNKESWKNAGRHLPAEANKESEKMKECCTSIKTTYELEVLEDLLKREIYTPQ